uniref:Uncharacterized protein n=1 Tax=Rhipicephalus zambeziensis TaxID=60191 RepID=A0A224Y916_9ACAR
MRTSVIQLSDKDLLISNLVQTFRPHLVLKPIRCSLRIVIQTYQCIPTFKVQCNNASKFRKKLLYSNFGATRSSINNAVPLNAARSSITMTIQATTKTFLDVTLINYCPVKGLL